jgi:hypothetical protein
MIMMHKFGVIGSAFLIGDASCKNTMCSVPDHQCHLMGDIIAD